MSTREPPSAARNPARVSDAELDLLLTEAEREYVGRAGTTTPFWRGASISLHQANCDGSAYSSAGTFALGRRKALPVDDFAPNPWGLHQVHGNVSEWVEDCFAPTYEGGRERRQRQARPVLRQARAPGRLLGRRCGAAARGEPRFRRAGGARRHDRFSRRTRTLTMER